MEGEELGRGGRGHRRLERAALPVPHKLRRETVYVSNQSYQNELLYKSMCAASRVVSSSSLLSSLELSDTKIYELYTRALQETAAHEVRITASYNYFT
jgi:hypothetical protein